MWALHNHTNYGKKDHHILYISSSIRVYQPILVKLYHTFHYQ